MSSRAMQLGSVMLKSSVLPDTCAWIDFFRGVDTPLSNGLEQALLAGSVVTCGVVQYELLQGIRKPGEEEMILSAFQAVPFLEMTQSLWSEAGRLAAQLRSKGHTLPLSDILIATLAKKHSAAILTVDKHFDLIPSVRVLS